MRTFPRSRAAESALYVLVNKVLLAGSHALWGLECYSTCPQCLVDEWPPEVKVMKRRIRVRRKPYATQPKVYDSSRRYTIYCIPALVAVQYAYLGHHLRGNKFGQFQVSPYVGTTLQLRQAKFG